MIIREIEEPVLSHKWVHPDFRGEGTSWTYQITRGYMMKIQACPVHADVEMYIVLIGKLKTISKPLANKFCYRRHYGNLLISTQYQ
jgi:hypothetical protein